MWDSVVPNLIEMLGTLLGRAGGLGGLGGPMAAVWMREILFSVGVCVWFWSWADFFVLG